MFCIICASKVFVECFGLMPCWVGDSGICGVIRFSMSRSITLKAVHSSVMGLYEVTSVWSLLGLRMVIMMFVVCYASGCGFFCCYFESVGREPCL